MAFVRRNLTFFKDLKRTANKKMSTSRNRTGRTRTHHLLYSCFYYLRTSVSVKLLGNYSRLKGGQAVFSTDQQSVHIWEGFALITNEIQFSKATNGIRDKVALCGYRGLVALRLYRFLHRVLELFVIA